MSSLRNTIKASLIPQNVCSYHNLAEGSVHLCSLSVDLDPLPILFVTPHDGILTFRYPGNMHVFMALPCLFNNSK
jgi:hypothetical protein